MYSHPTSDIHSHLAPLISATQIQQQTWMKLTYLQCRCFTNCLGIGLQQIHSLLEESEGSPDALQRQLQGIQTQVSDTAAEELNTLNQANEAMNSLMQQQYLRVTDLSLFKEVGDGVYHRQPLRLPF